MLCQHGYGDTGENWAGTGIGGPSMCLQLVDRGYDVWMGNNRGTKHSNVNDKDDGSWSFYERWNFTYADMGLYDMPAMIDKILEVTEKPKLTIIGYSQGSAQTYYGMVHN